MLGSLPIPNHAYYIDTAPIRVTLACKKSGLLIMWDRWKPAGSNFMLHFDRYHRAALQPCCSLSSPASGVFSCGISSDLAGVWRMPYYSCIEALMWSRATMLPQPNARGNPNLS